MTTGASSFKTTSVTLSFVVLVLFTITSCLKEMPETIPENLIWNPEVAFPLGEDSFGLNSISGFDTSLLELDTITGIPEWVEELEVVMERTLDLDLSSMQDNLERINRMLFRFRISNGFPNEVRVQAYFQDDGLNRIDSMFNEGPVLLSPGTVQDEGQTVNPTVIIKDAIVGQNRILLLQDVNTIFFQASILVGEVNLQLIPHYTSYHFDVEIGAMLDLRLEY
jgi:hypothetical protein